MITEKIDSLPIPPHFNPQRVGEVWRVRYQIRAQEAEQWAKQYKIQPASQDQLKTCLILIDVQNTFCIPEFELFVGGASGNGAVEDNIRLCEFIYRNLNKISHIIATLDTHTTFQIFHPIFWINQQGEHPTSATLISVEDIQNRIWKMNPKVTHRILGADENSLEQYALHYAQTLAKKGQYPLTVWPYHSMLGGIGHGLVSAVEEALFFHTISRCSQVQFEIKGNHPLTENYSVLQPEVLENMHGETIAQKNKQLIEQILNFDRILIAGQAKSHCVAWTIDNLLTEIQAKNSNLAHNVYLLEDCTSPVVIPGIVDYTEQANLAFQRFTTAGMQMINSFNLLE
ncbi:isochorismatase [Planktothrix sp. FACHB-1365]|uniref:isochorismatase n=1 Tax=Planktothrix sp. FACHB-1365 TaxID=2692855 RepID=UPI00168730FB|nr:isochorismatase [Planktothrix sp. FACHB-1365]MBD2483354.1 isochorismatase [Planktothrix sp. FACHB-1365]